MRPEVERHIAGMRYIMGHGGTLQDAYRALDAIPANQSDEPRALPPCEAPAQPRFWWTDRD